MSTISLLIDENGRFWESNSIELQQKHWAIGLRSDLDEYLVRNFGYIKIEYCENSSDASIAFTPAIIANRSVVAATELFLSRETSKFYVNMMGNEPTLLLIKGIDDLVALLIHHLGASSPLRRPTIFQQPLSIKRLDIDQRLAPLRERYEKWRRVRGDADGARTKGSLLPNRAQQYTARPGHGGVRFDEIGRALGVVQCMVNNKEGCLVQEQSDQNYGAWVSECLLQAAYEQSPAFELIEVDVKMTNGPKLRARYERLILPWKDSVGILLSVVTTTRARFPSISAD